VAQQSLNQLIQSITGAVAEAQEKIQRYQVATVRKYFDDDNRPLSIDVRLPSQAADAREGEEQLVRVPLLALVAPRLLAVKEMEIAFEVGLHAGDGDGDSAAPARDSRGWPQPEHKPLNVDLGVQCTGEGAPLARVTLRVETQPPCEGMARLIQHLNTLI
jgi:hypothetical protein